ncbi:DNA-binding protein [Hydrogenophaga sp.]|uniref:DNA-binding protein n=1 Tax=Hydrogenophaga sp. TaxID=1904254 RepID=UPI00271DA378|nr:DNA-binding protein [Hydrogenophaga sp.]MDO8904736.1 DNA-binding protein [Hydrogenophaga sp.]
MQALHAMDDRELAPVSKFPPLAHETRPVVDTAAAAHYLSRRPQTLRGWACLENGPLRPIRINGRLAWPVAELRRVLGVQ